MTALEGALVALVIVWTVFFAIAAIGLVVLFKKARRGLDRVNEILQTTKVTAQNVVAPVNAVATSIREVLTGERPAHVEATGAPGIEAPVPQT